jgi:5-methylcytosine-specific restriction enzyme subunit McrC
MRNLSYGYESKVKNLSRVRGRIDTLYTERHRLLDRGKVRCRFDELTVDTPRNRYVRAALSTLSKIVNRPALAHRCNSLSISLDRLGVKPGKSVGYKGTSERFARHDAGDQKMVLAADLAFDLAIPTEFSGSNLLATPDTNKEWLRKLFEKGVAGLYEVALDKFGWKVIPGKQLSWQIESKTSGIDAILPSMRTDIILENKVQVKQVVIDTKFNPITTKGWYRDQTLRSGYIYQMYAYLRSQVNIDKPLSLTATGMLLHPTTDIDMNESVTIQGHKICFCTVNLTKSAHDIKTQLLSFVPQS